MKGDSIWIEEMELTARIGVSAAERAAPQRLTATLSLEPLASFRALGDDLARTVDYAQVWQRVRELAAAGERRLLETLADELALTLLGEFRLAAVEIELRKFILPETRSVAVRLRRERTSP